MSHLNLKVGKLNIIDIIPESLNNRLWYCIGFEYSDQPLGDNLHLCFVYSNTFKTNTTDLWPAIKIALKSTVPCVRIHSECMLSETFGSDLCDCADQLKQSMETMKENGNGILFYLRQEGRGIGLRAKLPALGLQQGYDKGKYIGKYLGNYLTSDGANVVLGYPIDSRKYDIVTELLKMLHISRIKLITGNMDKIHSITAANIHIEKMLDVAIKDPHKTDRKFIEIREKLKRNYLYPSYKKLLDN